MILIHYRKWPKCYYKKYIGQKLEKGADEITYYMLLNGKGTFNGFIEDRNISKRTNKYKELKMTFKKIVERRYLTPVRITDSNLPRIRLQRPNNAN
ncbi:unnamed protein product [Rhizophagus irregularis]|nr:unnamed protein product [Rhizophagus irregularis]